MASKIVTPPDKFADRNSYLIINAAPLDIEMVSRWLRTAGKDYTIHLYYTGMDDLTWLKETAGLVEKILVERATATPDCMSGLYDDLSKIVWFGTEQEYPTIIDYFTKNG